MRETWLVPLCAVTACFSPAAPSGLPCGEGLTCPEGQSCDIISNECGVASEALILRDNTAEDFAPGTGDVTREPQGVLSPAAYLTGSVRVHGYDGLFAAEAFDDIVATHPRTGTALQRSTRIHYLALNPAGLGIADADNATVVVEGEIELEVAGTWRFTLTANDEGYFELAPPGSASFERIANDVDTGTIASYDVGQPGWHPFRAVFQDAGGLLDFDLTYDPPNVTGNGFRDIPTDRLRVIAGDLANGLVLDGFEHGNLIELNASILHAGPLQDVPLGTSPFGMPLGTTYSARWSGQFLVDEPGDFTFTIDSPDGHRMWIDGTELANDFASGASSTTAPITLAAGWHDLVLDVNKSGAVGAASLIVESGPQFAGGPLPLDHLRPVIGRRARFLSDRALTPVPLPDGTGVTGIRSLNLDVPDSLGQPLEVRAAVEVDAASLDTISMVIDPPSGANIPVFAAGDVTGMGVEFRHVLLSAGNLGVGWNFIGNDAVPDMLTAEITSAYVTVIYDGGIAPFATTSRYESAVRDLGDAVAFERIAWITRGDPAAIVVRWRTCETEDCAGESYVDVVNNTEPSLTPRRFAQYQVEITSDGESSPALDAIELRYFVRTP